EIIEISKNIGTYETSIEPYEDCCTVFLPDAPITRPKLKNVERELKKLGDVDALIDESIANLEIIEIV
ncbi:MAG: tRNA 4-thiouridine(8) synthase ThiI, partial [Candidatus Neoclostridium sp.]